MSFEVTRTKLGPRFSEGARLLFLLMKKRGWSRNDLARELETRSGDVCRWLSGDIRPGLDWATKIQKRFPAIRVALWMKDPVQPLRIDAHDP